MVFWKEHQKTIRMDLLYKFRIVIVPFGSRCGAGDEQNNNRNDYSQNRIDSSLSGLSRFPKMSSPSPNSLMVKKNYSTSKPSSFRKNNLFITILGIVIFILTLKINIDLASAIGTCKSGELRCQISGHCVPKEQVCDGVRDCEDGLDENDLICSPKFRRSLCGARVKKHVFQCQYGGCIPISRVCDGSINCLDGSDEREDVCAKNSCLPGQFRCKYGACIPDYRLCNGQVNCPDGSDETGDVCKKRVCKDDQFMCRYGGCIPEKKICDGWKNCADGSDESAELCLITRAKMQQAWEKAELLDSEFNDEYRPISAASSSSMLSLNRRPTRPPTTTTPSPTGSTLFKKSTTKYYSTAKAINNTLYPTAPASSSTIPKKLIDISDIFSDPTTSTIQSLSKNCTLPEIPGNSEATITSCRTHPEALYCITNTSTVPYGVTIDFQCSPGYVLNGPVAISCQEGGLWSSTPPTCEAILDVRFGLGKLIPRDFKARCPPLSPTRGVQIECINPKNLEISLCSEAQKPGVEARFSCAPYYRPAGDLPMHYEKCDEDGRWSPGIDTNFNCIPDCGLSEVPKTPYILNGQPTKSGQWPWHVGIYVKNDNDKLKYICGGALISEQSVLTSAHCVTINGHVRNSSTIVMFLGKQKLELPDNDPFVQKREAAQIIVEDSYNHLALDSDIALIALDTPAVLSYYVRPACYPQTSNSFLEEYQLAQGNLGTVLGWGLTENGTLAESLKMTELPVVSTVECADSHKDFFASQTRSTTYCAGYRNGTSVCNGDSGGGMYFRAVIRGSSRWYVQGLVSYGVPEEGTKRCASLHYAVFTRVGRYGDWIVRTLSRENLI